MRETTVIEQELLAAMKSRPLSDELFNALAILVFAHQFEHNPAYRQWCQTKGTDPSSLTRWQDIPAVPTNAFKLEDYPLVTFPLDNTQKTFLTSGTTAEVKGEHHFPSLDLYNQSIIHAWQELDLPKPEHAVFLVPPPDQAPHSSLSHMMGVLADSLAEKTTWAMDQRASLDIDAIQRASSSNQAVALIGTALAFLHFFESIDTPLSLPPESWAMETGGYKGSKRHLHKEDLYHLFEQNLNLPPESVINEYSMTELSSQFYSRGLNQAHTGPSWTRVRVIDPVTNTDAKPGEPGHLAIYDLANLHSVMAIRTEDLALQSKADLARGINGFTLLGRDPSALPRGCSRAADHRLSS